MTIAFSTNLGSSKKRRGRPRLDRPARDFGTQELRDKRRNLVTDGQTKNPVLAESLLGLFYAHGIITKVHYEAGRQFGELGYRYEACLGHTFRQRASIITHIGNGDRNRDRNGVGTSDADSPALDATQIHAWRKALAALQQAGRTPTTSVLRVVFHDQDLYTNIPPLKAAFLSDAKPLRQGLDQLDAHFQEAPEDARDKPADLALNLPPPTRLQRPSRARPRLSLAARPPSKGRLPSGEKTGFPSRQTGDEGRPKPGLLSLKKRVLRKAVAPLAVSTSQGPALFPRHTPDA